MRRMLEVQKNQLKSGIEQLSLKEELRDSQLDQLLLHLVLLNKWNKAYNLTAIKGWSQQVTHHLLDSLMVVPYIKGEQIIDVGSGGGFPGVVLAVAMPEKRFTLLDSNSKKTRFLVQVVHELALKNVQVVGERLESYHPEIPFDAMISRAFAKPEDTLEKADTLVYPSGHYYFMQGQCNWTDRPGYSAEVIALHVPGLSAQRHLIIVSKVPSTW